MTDTVSEKKKPLPPGTIIGPDGKPCKLCTATRDWKRLVATPDPNSQRRKSGHPSTAAAMAAALASGTHTPSPPTPPDSCPLDIEQLGRATWSFLHTTAAYYPDRPTPTQRANMLGLIRALPVLYPCTHCASHLGDNIKEHPPDVSGRMPLSRWFCERHNDVNERLGKEKFDCAKTDERWKDGPEDGSCD